MNLFDILADIDQERARERGEKWVDPRTELHYHKCPEPSCGHIWSHRQIDLKTSKQHAEGHTCPMCKHGTQIWKCGPNGEEH